MTSFVQPNVDWDQLSVGSNESFFDRSHSDHEPLEKALARLNAEMDKENHTENARKSRTETREKVGQLPLAKVRPRSLPRKAPSTIPITPNVLKKRTLPRVVRNQPTPYKFKAKPAPTFHKSASNLNRITTQLQNIKLASSTSSDQPPAQRPNTRQTTTRVSRAEVRPNERPQQTRSRSVPSKVPVHSTVPITPQVLKRNVKKVNVAQKTEEVCFKAKPAVVLQRQPFKPKLNNPSVGISAASTGTATKPFEFRLGDRLKERKLFNHRTTDALEKRNKQMEEEKLRKLDEKCAAARRLTNFRATRNPFK